MTQVMLVSRSRERDRCEVACLHPDLVAGLEPRLLDAPSVLQVSRLFGILADPTRVRLLDMLSVADELCVCDLAWLADMSVSSVSHQLRYLRERGVVSRRRRGRLVFYRLDDDHVRQLLAGATEHTREHYLQLDRVWRPPQQGATSQPGRRSGHWSTTAADA